ncbi:electron transport complex subunit RsxE [Fusicatenibacter sp.]|uniref:electron transport complex subunit RsxE n=1 Tax=Fusicatenibacter sp. TaxID=2773922 RepID=UPI00399BB5FC
MNKAAERLHNGLVKENPTFVLMLGMCPTLAVTTLAVNGIGMGLTTTVILALSNVMISALRKVIPDGVRMPAYIVIVASFVTIVQFLLQAYLPNLYDSLGIYIPLIVVNCIILGRAEAYASKNPVIPSFFDGLGMGLGFTVGLTAIGIVRELIGSGKIFGFQVMPSAYEPVTIFILAPGAFLVLTLLVALQNRVKRSLEKKGIETKIGSGCTGECASCQESCKGGKNA